LNGFENGGFKRLRKSGVEGACFLALAVDCLEIVKPTLSGHLALELLETVKGHAGGICSGEREVRIGETRGKKGWGNELVGVEYFACLDEIKDMLVGIRLSGLQEGI